MRKQICRIAVIALGSIAITVGLVSPVAARNAYVGQTFAGGVSVIDTGRIAVATTVPVANNLRGIAITPDGSRAYVSGVATDTVYVLDTRSNTVAGTIPVENPGAIAITPDGRRAYVTRATLPGSVAVIDTQANAVVGAAITVGTSPTAIAITPDGNRAYVTNYSSKNVSVIDTVTNSVVGGPIAVASTPWGIAVTPDGNRAYVTIDASPGSISVIDTRTNAVADVVALGAGSTFPIGIAITPSGSRAYSTNLENVSVIDTRTNTVIGPPIDGGGRPSGIAITPDGGRAFFANYNSNDVWALDLPTGTALGAPIGVGKNPESIAIVPNQPPTAVLSTPGHGLRVTLDGSTSSDPDGAIASYHWDFGDGTSAQTASPTVTHIYKKAFSYFPLMTVSDGEGCPGFVFTGQTALCNGPSSVGIHRLLVTAEILKLRRNPKNGTAKLLVHVPGKVTVELAGKGIARQRPRFKVGLGTISLRVKAKGRARRKLDRTGFVKVKVRVTVRPIGGDPNVQTKRVRLVKETRRR